MNQKAPDTTGAAPDSTQPGPNRGSGVHVDVENLYLNAQFVIRELLTNWPEEKAPYPWALNLYVTADQTELWKTWAESRFPDIRINVLGTQRFSMAPTKNSADITLVLNAAMDILTGKADHIVLVSNDSDYIALHTAIRDWHQETHPESEVTPFLWVMTDEEKRISRTIQQFFPSEQLHTIPIPSGLRNNDNDNYPHPLPFSDTQPGPERRNQRPHPQATPSPEAEKGKEDGELQQKQEPGTGHPARNGTGSKRQQRGRQQRGRQQRTPGQGHQRGAHQTQGLPENHQEPERRSQNGDRGELGTNSRNDHGKDPHRRVQRPGHPTDYKKALARPPDRVRQPLTAGQRVQREDLAHPRKIRGDQEEGPQERTVRDDQQGQEKVL